MTGAGSVIDWLLDSDPSIRWQVMRDLLDAPESEWGAERAKVETEGWGARLLSCRGRGRAVGGRRVRARATSTGSEWEQVGQPWTATVFSLSQLREFGLDPASDRARRAVELIGANSRWDHDGQPYWEGEVEECINGRTVADGAYFGVDVSSIVDRLVGERLDDGGWNCERANGSVRSSFDSTINVLEGLLEYETSHRRHAGVPSGAQLGRGVSPGAQPLPSPQHRRAGRRAIPDLPASEPLALRRPAGAGLLPLGRRPDRRRPRPATRRSRRPSSVAGARRTAPGRSTGA